MWLNLGMKKISRVPMEYNRYSRRIVSYIVSYNSYIEKSLDHLKESHPRVFEGLKTKLN